MKSAKNTTRSQMNHVGLVNPTTNKGFKTPSSKKINVDSADSGLMHLNLGNFNTSTISNDDLKIVDDIDRLLQSLKDINDLD